MSSNHRASLGFGGASSIIRSARSKSVTIGPDVATELRELAEKIEPNDIVAGADRVARSDVQRWGWLLDLVEDTVLTDALAKKLEGERLQPTPLTSSCDSSGVPLDARWRLRLNGAPC